MQKSKQLIVVASLFISLLSIYMVLLHKTPSEATATTMEQDKAATHNVLDVTEIHGVNIHRNPPHSKLDQLGVTTWNKWAGQPSKIPWTFEAKETMYLLEGKVEVSIDGHEGSFEIRAGDLVTFPKGMKISWNMLEAVNKHYSLEK